MISLNIGFLASHSGTSMRAIFEAIASHRLPAKVTAVISNNENSEALRFAKCKKLPSHHISVKSEGSSYGVDCAIARTLQASGSNLVVLSGYLRLIGPVVLARFQDRILNVHPALLPDFGGQGMYGNRVHEAVLKSGKMFSGATIHIVNSEYDQGPIIAQEQVRVLPNDTPQTLAKRIAKVETTLFVETLIKISSGDHPISNIFRSDGFTNST